MRTPDAVASCSFGGDSLYLGYNYNAGQWSVSDVRSQLTIKTSEAATITVNNLHMGRSKFSGGTVRNKATIEGSIIVDGTAIIAPENLTSIILNSTVTTGTIGANKIVYLVGDSTKHVNFAGVGQILDCKFDATIGEVAFGHANNDFSFGDNFGLTLKEGTTLTLGSNFIGKAGTKYIVAGNAFQRNAANTGANKNIYSDLIINESATLNLVNNSSAASRGNMIFNGTISGAGNLVVNTLFSDLTTANTVYLKTANNADFTGNVTVTTGTLQLDGANALINATSVTNNSIINVGTTSQTLKNLSGSGLINSAAAGVSYSGKITGAAQIDKKGAGARDGVFLGRFYPAFHAGTTLIRHASGGRCAPGIIPAFTR